MPSRKVSLTAKIAAFNQLKSGKKVPEVAKALNIDKTHLYAWIREYKKRKTKSNETAESGSQDSLEAIAASIPLRSYRRFDEDFKKQVVQQMLNGTPVAELVEQYKIAAETLSRWPLPDFLPNFRGKSK